MKVSGVEELFVYGDSLKSELVGIIVPNEGYVRKFAKCINLPDDTELAIICKNDKIVKHFLD